MSAVGAAAFCFLSLLGLGAVLVVAAKLDDPALGAGAGPLDVMSGIVVLGLAGIGVTLELGRLSLDAFPLGAVLLWGWIVSWAGRTAVHRRNPGGHMAAAIEGMKLAVPLGLICFAAALVFQVGQAQEVVRLDPAMALFVPSLWGALFGAAGGLRSRGSLASHAGRALARIGASRQGCFEGVIAAANMLVVTAVLSSVALLVIVMVTVIGGRPSPQVTVGDALSVLVYLVVFGPNLVVLLACFALGTPVEVGARVAFGARPIGGFESVSLLGWAGSSPGRIALLLLLVPLCGCLLGAFMAGRNTSGTTRSLQALGIGAVVYAAGLSLLGWLSGVRIGGGILGSGSGRLVPEAGTAFLLALLWALGAGWIGGRLAEVSGPRTSIARWTGRTVRLKR